MDNPVGQLMELVYKFKLKRPNFQFRKNQGKWQCTCLMTLATTTLEETALAQTKKEAKAQSARQILAALEPYLNKI